MSELVRLRGKIYFTKCILCIAVTSIDMMNSRNCDFGYLSRGAVFQGAVTGGTVTWCSVGMCLSTWEDRV